MKVRLAGMTGVAGLGKKAEIGQAVLTDQVQPLLKEFGIPSSFKGGVEKHQPQETKLEKEYQNEKARFSHRDQSRMIMGVKTIVPKGGFRTRST
jgi:hypothetical protein